jgi:peptidyl-prolyl cis-trans isomerase SurA
MKFWLSFLVLLLLITSPLAVKAEEVVVDGMAAIVNSQVITFSQVRELVAAQEKAAAQTYQGKELEDKIKEIRQAAMRDLIDRALILQEFKKKEFSIPEYYIDGAIQKIIREDFGGDRIAFLKTLQAQGYSLARFRQSQKDKLIVQVMRNAKLKDNYVISPVKVRSYYEKNRELYATPEQVKLRMIVLHEEDASSPDHSKKQMAEEIRQKIAGGAEFDRMAQMYSEDSTQDSGGDWGWVEQKTLNTTLSQAAFSMKAGEVSRVIPLENSYYILMVEAVKKASVKPFTEVQREIEQNFIEQEKLQTQELWLKSLHEKAYIKIL